MGPARMRLSKPVIAAVAGHAWGRRPGTRALVPPPGRRAAWNSPSGATRGSPRREAVFGVFRRRWGVPLIDGGTCGSPG